MKKNISRLKKNMKFFVDVPYVILSVPAKNFDFILNIELVMAMCPPRIFHVSPCQMRIWPICSIGEWCLGPFWHPSQRASPGPQGSPAPPTRLGLLPFDQICVWGRVGNGTHAARQLHARCSAAARTLLGSRAHVPRQMRTLLGSSAHVARQ